MKSIQIFSIHMSAANTKNKWLVLGLLWLAPVFASAQGPRFFHYHEIAGNLHKLRKASVEYIAVAGNNTEKGDSAVLDTLRMFLGRQLLYGAQPLWPRFHNEVKNIQIRKANWRQLPEDLAGFRHLFEISFVECPYINLQVINDQMKARRDQNPADNLYRKFKNDIVSLSFAIVRFPEQDSCHLEDNLMEELKELRFVGIPNFSVHCSNILTELSRAYPKLGWLTFECCGLNNTADLKALEKFPNLKSVSLIRNYLTQVPPLPKSLNALDLSFNLLSELPDKKSLMLQDLDFLYLDCNLFDYYNLYKVLSDSLLNRMEVFTYDPCNFDNQKELPLLASALDKRKIALYMPFVPRYHNDFNIAQPDCERCTYHHSGFIDSLLNGVVFVDSTGQESRISFRQNRMQWETAASTTMGPVTSIYFYEQLKSCQRYFYDPSLPDQMWDWRVCFLLQDTDTMHGGVKKLVLQIRDKSGKAYFEKTENR